MATEGHGAARTPTVVAASSLWSWPLLAGALLWWSGPVLAPYAATRGWWAAPLLYLLYQPICHQMAERSFEFWGGQLGVCHRCLGLYSGFVVGLVLMPLAPTWRRWLTEHPWRIVLFVLPLVIDVSLYRTNVPTTRLLTGLVAAIPLALLAQLAAHQLRTSRRSRARDGAGQLTR